MKKFSMILLSLLSIVVLVACGPTVAPITTYKVSFDVQGGTPSISHQEIEMGKFASIPAEPTKAGYIFLYWFYDTESESFEFTTTPITADITLKALWQAEVTELTTEEKIQADITALSASLMLNKNQVNTLARGSAFNSAIKWTSVSPYISEHGVVLTVAPEVVDTTAHIKAKFTLSGVSVEHTFEVELPKYEPVVLSEERSVAFKNQTTEYNVLDSDVTLYFETEGSVPYIKVEDYFNLITGFIDPAYEITFTTEDDVLTVFYQYFSEEENVTYDMFLYVDAVNDTITTNDPGFYWAYVYSTETNYGRHIEYDNDNPNASSIEGGDVIYDLSLYGMDIVVEDGDVVLPFYVANQLFAGSSYYNVYYNYDGLFGIYSLPESGSPEYRAIKRSTLNNTDVPADLLVHTFHFLSFSLNNFYGLKDIMEVEDYYDLLLENSNSLLNPDPQELDQAISTLLLKKIDEPHTSYGYPSYFNKSSWAGPSVSSLADYGSRFYNWYMNGLVATDTQIGNKWGNVSGSGWNASNPNRPNWWFLDETTKTSAVLSLDGFQTADIEESSAFDGGLVSSIFDLTDTQLLPEVLGTKFWYYNSSTKLNDIAEVLVKQSDANYASTYEAALLAFGYEKVLETTTDSLKSNGYFKKLIGDVTYMVQVAYDASLKVFYVSISDLVPTLYSDSWLVYTDIVNLVDSDNAVYMELMMDQILEASPLVENMVLDLTWNTGGNVGALYRVVGFITDQPFSVTSIDKDTGGASTSYVLINGVPTYAHLNWALLVTPTSFSAANSMATIFMENKLGPIIGITTGGGASSITPILLPNGTAFTMSSNNVSAYRLGDGTEESPYTYHNNEFGITPDYPIEMANIYNSNVLLAILDEHFSK